MGLLLKGRTILNKLVRPAGFELVRVNRSTMTEALKRLPNHGFAPNTIVDIGASIGSWSSEIRSVFPNAKILMIEALEERRDDLEKEVRKAPQTTIAHIGAVGPAKGVTSFVVTNDLDGSGADAGNAQQSETSTLRDVPMDTLDSLAGHYHLKSPFIIKFDTHGFELPILEGAQSMLRETQAVIMECYLVRSSSKQLLFWEMCTYMEGLGFRCFDLVDPLLRPLDGALWQLDLFFARSDWPGFNRLSYQ